MPVFTTKQEGTDFWLPTSRLVKAEAAPGGLSTMLTILLATPKGEALATVEVAGRCSVLGAAIDKGEPTEVGQ